MSETGTTTGTTTGTPGTSDTKRRVLLLAGGAVGAALVVLVLLVTVFEARLDAPTIALAGAAAALVYALGQLYAMVWALSRPDRVAQVGQAAGSFTQAELRDEKRRLLRAIKELEFDFGMGKLSQVDHDTVIATYRLRAIEVMRALEGGSSLHPELARMLAERDSAATASSASSAAATASETTSTAKHDVPVPSAAEPIPGPAASGPFDQTTRICGTCGGTNDPDARFCKSCGKQMRKGDPSSTPRPAQPARSGEIGGGAS